MQLGFESLFMFSESKIKGFILEVLYISLRVSKKLQLCSDGFTEFQNMIELYIQWLVEYFAKHYSYII